MAVIKTTAIIADIRNKLGGTVFSKNRAGQYMRTKVTPSNPQSLNQTLVRAHMAENSAYWRSLTNDQRNGWNNLAEVVSATNIFGDAIKLTGMQLFCKLNNNLTNAGVAKITTAPAAPSPANSLTALELAMAEGPTATITFAPTPVPAAHKLVIFATPGQSASRLFYKNKLCRIVNIAAATASPYDATAAYSNRYPDPAVGQLVGMSAMLVNTTTGFASTPVSVSTIVEAA